MSQKLPSVLAVSLFWVWSISTGVAEQPESISERVNKGTVGVVSGGIHGTYVRIAADLASVLDDGENLRVIPILGKGSVQNITDILYLKGIDVGIVQSDVLTFVARENIHPNIEEKIHYITKLYNEEVHILARKGINKLQDLAGHKVNFGNPGSGTNMTASILFDTLKIKVEPVRFDQALALDKMKRGEIAGLVYVAGKPTRLFLDLREEDNFQFLSIPHASELLRIYLPSRFTHDDYPHLVRPGHQVKTLAVGAVMAVYNWKPTSSRFAKVSRFIEAFFSKFGDFQKPPRHPKWKEVSLTALVPGWTRFRSAEELLK